FAYLTRLTSVYYFEKALTVLGNKNTESAAIAVRKANIFYPHDLYLRTESQLALTKLNALASQTSLSDKDQASVQDVLSEALTSSARAVEYDRDNYQNYAMLGYVYSTAATLGVGGAL